MIRTVARRAALAAALVATSLVALPALSQEPREVLAELAKKSSEFTSSETVTTTTVKNAYMESKTVSTSWTHRAADGTIKMRSEMTSTMTMPGMDPQESKTLMVSDGKVMFSEMDMMGNKMVTKTKVPESTVADGMKYYLDMLDQGSAKLLADEAINGKACTVIEITSPDASTTTLWLDKETGTVMKTVMKGEAIGESVTTVDSIKTGVEIDEAMFAYTPPEGAVVQDMTGM